MLPVFRGAPHAPRGTHDEQSCLELGRPGLSNAKTQPDPTARRTTLLESCNKFSLLIGSRVNSLIFRTASSACGKVAVTKIHAMPVSDSRQSDFSDRAMWKSLTIIFLRGA